MRDPDTGLTPTEQACMNLRDYNDQQITAGFIYSAFRAFRDHDRNDWEVYNGLMSCMNDVTFEVGEMPFERFRETNEAEYWYIRAFQLAIILEEGF